MSEENHYDVIVIGGSYSGLAAGMALGRSMRKVLLIDSGKPCNRQTPHSHNFLTRDGETPQEIARLARQQVAFYPTVAFEEGEVTEVVKAEDRFRVRLQTGEMRAAKKLVFATGVKDLIPGLPGFAECWGISVLHCPYCHGYEVRHQTTGVFANGDLGYEIAVLISNWTKDLALFTNGQSTLTPGQVAKLKQHNIAVDEREVAALEHQNGYLQNLRFQDGSVEPVKALYTRLPFVQHSPVPESLGCELTPDGYLKVDPMQRTTVHGIYACGDNTTRMRTVANAVAMGTTAGMMVNKEMIEEAF